MVPGRRRCAEPIAGRTPRKLRIVTFLVWTERDLARTVSLGSVTKRDPGLREVLRAPHPPEPPAVQAAARLADPAPEPRPERRAPPQRAPGARRSRQHRPDRARPVGPGRVRRWRRHSPGRARLVRGDAPVVMGRDGGAVSSSTFAGVSTAPGARHSSTDAFAAPPSTPEVAPAPAETAAPADTAPPEAPAEAPSPPPVVEEAPAPPPPAPAPAAVPANLGAEDQVLALVNIQRAAAGCGALSGDAALASVARAHSADMRDRGFFSHTNPDGLDPFARAAAAGLDARAENIAYGQPDPASVMDSWMNSPGHRANILDCSLTRLGVGMAEGAGGPWW